MSSTNRGRGRQPSDYYCTPIRPIREFIDAFFNDTSFAPDKVLDPCAGGDADNPMSYPAAISFSQWDKAEVYTMDIRQDSPAAEKGDYLKLESRYIHADLIFSNPPFNLAVPFIQKGLEDVAPGGWVIMLQRLNFFGSQGRKAFWQSRMPVYTYVHSERMAFTTKKSNEIASEISGKPLHGRSTDSIEYAHFCWQRDNYPKFTKLRVI